MSTVRENIEAGKYYVKGKRAFAKPEKPRCPEEPSSSQAYLFADDMAEYEKGLLAWEADRERVRKEQVRLYEEVLAGDLAEENGLSGPVADMVFKRAWTRSYLQGLEEVCEEYKNLSILVSDIKEHYCLG